MGLFDLGSDHESGNWPLSPQEAETRNIGNFDAIEKSMPGLPQRFASLSLKDNLSSYLGARNPFGQRVQPGKHEVWLLDNTAWQDGDEWKAEFVAAYFVKNSGFDLSRIVADLTEKLGVGEGDDVDERMHRRLQPFVDGIAPAHYINIGIAGKHTERLGPSGRDGLSTTKLTIPGSHGDGEVITSSAVQPNVATNPLVTTFASPTGWAVLSDVDDTIKITQTSSPLGILKTTFVDEPQVVAGMPELYKHIHSALKQPPFWYLSASPYNLYPFLHSFRSDYYPPGPLILREASWMNLAGFLASLTRGTQDYKTEEIERLHRDFPQRKFLCIGDSTQTDPESYAEMYRKYPKWIRAIYIRRVSGQMEMDQSHKNENQRFEEAFRDIPKEIWHVFDDPRELYAKVDQLASAS
ncbi:actin filament organization protein-like protein App1-like protein [Lineolata rhizophorae]|uniref:Actin filament organization protein-like protein App1-like protein n=1 Tax=Lineolata rhizophorae TaxID=578093 RepID=A0A6A6PD65_9PEZI|nr:actin filament organization protein-like protein App1-like protein [Lineolata rhizophorae]